MESEDFHDAYSRHIPEGYAQFLEEVLRGSPSSDGSLFRGLDQNSCMEFVSHCADNEKEGVVRDILRHIDLFSEDFAWDLILEKLFEKQHMLAAADLLSLSFHFSPDVVKRVAEKLLALLRDRTTRLGKFAMVLIVQYHEHFKEYINVNHLWDQVATPEDKRMIAGNLKHISGCKEEIAREILGSMDTYGIREVVRNLDAFENLPESIRPFLTPFLLEEYCNAHRFEGLANALACLSLVERQRIFPQSVFEEKLQTMMADHNWSTALSIVRCIQLCNYTIEKRVVKEVQTHAKHEQFARRHRSAGEKKSTGRPEIQNEAILHFYALELISASLRHLDYKLDMQDAELSFQDKVRFHVFQQEVVSKLHAVVDELFASIKHPYLMIQIARDAAGPRVRGTTLSSGEELIFLDVRDIYGKTDIAHKFRYLTAEETRSMFAQYTQAFLYGYSNGFGGRVWSDIAQLAYDLHRDALDTSSKILLIDRAFQIAHQRGHVFLYGKQVKLLDIVFQATDLKNLLERSKEYIQSDDPSMSDLEECTRTISYLEMSFERRRGKHSD